MTSSPSLSRVVLAAGGTAGHVFPALAIYQHLIANGVEAWLLTDERGKRWATDFAPEHVQVLPSGGLVTGTLAKRIGNVGKLAQGYRLSRRTLRELDPDAVVGLGGYAAVGPLLAAQHMGIANVLHEQNSVMGLSNRVSARGADAVALSFDPTEGARGKCTVTGNPSRPEVIAVGEEAFTVDEAGPLGILVMGGSQGARSISDNVPAALASCAPALRSRLRVVHQARSEDHDRVTVAYAEAAIDATVTDFVNVPEALTGTHLVVGRSGASTVCDMAVARRPAVYLPLLTHSDLQQVKNAQAVVNHGGALLHREDEGTVSTLASTLEALLTDSKRLIEMANAAHAWSRPNAAIAILDLITR